MTSSKLWKKPFCDKEFFEKSNDVINKKLFCVLIWVSYSNDVFIGLNEG